MKAQRPTVSLEDILASERPVLATFRRDVDPVTDAELRKQAILDVRASMSALGESTNKRPVRLFSPATMRKTMMQFATLYEQYAFGAIGMRYPAIIRVNGAESTGKTTFLLRMAGQWLARKCPVIYIDCENKTLAENRVQAILHRDPAESFLMHNSLYLSQASQVAEFDDQVRQLLAEARKNCDSHPETKGNPILVIGDTWTTLMSEGQAKGRTSWGMETKQRTPDSKTKDWTKGGKNELADNNTGSNFGHAKHARALNRELPSLLKKYNAVLAIATHQTEAISMMPGVPPTPPYKNGNCTARKALDAVAAYVVVLSKLKEVKRTDGTVIGTTIRAYMLKNTFGPPFRSFFFDNMSDDLIVTPTYVEDPVSFADTTAAWMAKEGLAGTTVNKKRYTCDAIGALACTGKAFYEKLVQAADVVASVGASLNIYGYETPDEVRRKAAVGRASVASEAAEEPAEEDPFADVDAESPDDADVEDADTAIEEGGE